MISNIYSTILRADLMGVVSLLVELSYLSVVCICTKSESEHVTGMRNLLAQHSWRLRYCGLGSPLHLPVSRLLAA